MLGALCEYLLPQFAGLADYRTPISAIKAAQKKRNRLVHNTITLDEKSGAILMASGSARGSLKTAVEKLSIANIRRASISASEAQNSLYKLVLGVDYGPAWKRIAARKKTRG